MGIGASRLRGFRSCLGGVDRLAGGGGVVWSSTRGRFSEGLTSLPGRCGRGLDRGSELVETLFKILEKSMMDEEGMTVMAGGIAHAKSV